ncbi:MAG: GtrA family protein [Clostridiales bacterium]|jgi:putative flippase GtrA|nr:GtrA family protein [Clostridiales bacterium]
MRNLIKKVIENPLLKKYVNRETVLYVIFGVLTTIVNYAAFYIFDKTFENASLLGKNGYLVANILAWIAAVVFAFITNKIYVFESRSWNIAIVSFEFAGFVGARLFSLLVEMGCMWLFVSRLGMHKYLAKLIISVAVIILNYVFSKLFIFKKKEGG